MPRKVHDRKWWMFGGGIREWSEHSLWSCVMHATRSRLSSRPTPWTVWDFIYHVRFWKLTFSPFNKIHLSTPNGIRYSTFHKPILLGLYLEGREQTQIIFENPPWLASICFNRTMYKRLWTNIIQAQLETFVSMLHSQLAALNDECGQRLGSEFNTLEKWMVEDGIARKAKVRERKRISWRMNGEPKTTEKKELYLEDSRETP